MENFNSVELGGKIIDVMPKFLAKSGIVCTRCKIVTTRYSSIDDIIELVIPETVAKHEYIVSVSHVIDNRLIVHGSIRTTNINGKLIQYVYVDSTSEEEPGEPLNLNNIKLSCIITRKPTYRHTPLGRVITDLFVAHNVDNKHVSYYIPCIAWGSTGVKLSNYDVGTKLVINGRYQSRIYKKFNGKDMIEFMVNELSINSFEVIEDGKQKEC